MKVAVVCGGFSEEQNASRKSGKNVAEALEKLSHTVEIVEYSDQLINEIKKISPDAVFHMVQGKYHGDGTVQALLELTGIPYTGSRPYSAALINHKTICKKIWRSGGVLTPDFFEYSYEEYKKDKFDDFLNKLKKNNLTLPVVVKAPSQGSRYGIIFVKGKESFNEMEAVFNFDDVLLVERYVEGRFITQGLIEINGKMTTLPPVEIVDDTGDEFKMFPLPGGAAARAHDFSPESIAEINRITSEAAALTEASGVARLDYHLSGGKLYLLEINAVPGLIPGYSSMIDCAAAAGYDYLSLIGMILAAAK